MSLNSILLNILYVYWRYSNAFRLLCIKTKAESVRVSEISPLILFSTLLGYCAFRDCSLLSDLSRHCIQYP